MTKLTLSMEKEVVEQAKRLAAERGTSVSRLVSDFVQSLAAHASPKHRRPREIGPLTRQAIGIGRDIPQDKDYKDLIEEALLEKYGLSK